MSPHGRSEVLALQAALAHACARTLAGTGHVAGHDAVSTSRPQREARREAQ